MPQFGLPWWPEAKNMPVTQETWVQSLGWEDLLEEGMATTPVFLPEESHEQRSLVGYSPWGHKELDTTEQLTLSKGKKKDSGTFLGWLDSQKSSNQVRHPDTHGTVCF